LSANQTSRDHEVAARGILAILPGTSPFSGEKVNQRCAEVSFGQSEWAAASDWKAPMARNSQFMPTAFLPYRERDQVPKAARVYDVSSYAEHPFCTLSPMWPHGGIPVPGMSGTTSDSVEGIWQGLKVIRGKIAPRFFSGPGQKRGGKPSGHRYGTKLLKIVEARERIYRVAYEWVLTNRVDQALIEEFVRRAFAGETQLFHDVSDNGSIGNPDEGWAHAAVLVQYLNRLCKER
jgi:hypothetical protein